MSIRSELVERITLQLTREEAYALFMSITPEQQIIETSLQVSGDVAYDNTYYTERLANIAEGIETKLGLILFPKENK